MYGLKHGGKIGLKNGRVLSVVFDILRYQPTTAMTEPKPLSGISSDDWKKLFALKGSPETFYKVLLFVVGVFLTPITLAGAFIWYARGYNRFMRPKGKLPTFSDAPPIVKAAMIIGAVLIWVFVYYGIKFYVYLVAELLPWRYQNPMTVVYLLTANILVTFFVYALFRQWRNGVMRLAQEEGKFGTARWADADELKAYTKPEGLYIGGGYTFSDKGHILTVAGTRGGKGTNLIIPNLLGINAYQGSWVVIDPKAENAAITARYQKETGRDVVVLNPWGLFADKLDASRTYNPLDLLSDISSIHLVDDAQIIAEMLVPIDKHGGDRFFTDNARSIITGLLLHLVTSQEKEKQTLTTLWEWLRLRQAKWEELLEDMTVNDDPVNGKIINNSANEILKLMAAGERTFGSILATALQCTDFLKSKALQDALTSDYDPKNLADGNTALYIIIPADKLQSHSKWLRLVTTTLLRAVVRKPNKRVTFLLDEFAALGYISEIETALSTYAGYEVTVWPILQSLIQLKKNYGDGWETFIGNTAVRQYFSVNDNFTANYVSAAIGTTSYITQKRNKADETESSANARALITPDELRRASGDNIFAFMGEKPPTYYPKKPYYTIEGLKQRYDENPYITQSK